MSLKALILILLLACVTKSGVMRKPSEATDTEEKKEFLTGKTHIHAHHKNDGEFVDTTEKEKWISKEGATSQEEERKDAQEVVKSGEDSAELRKSTTRVEVGTKRVIKCIQRLTNAGNVSSHIYGEECCDPHLEDFLISTREYEEELLGDTAKRIQRQLQKHYDLAFEIFISSDEFIVASYYHGQRMCKLHINGLHVLAYQTPSKHNVSFYEQEAWLAGVDAQEDLGSTLEVDREDWADIRLDPLANLGAGTHCIRERRTGNKCCHRPMFDMLVSVIDQAATSADFNSSIETPGVVANVIKKRVQQRFARIFEIVVSKKDFVQATYAIGDFTCKIKRKELYVLAFETPRQTGYNPYNKEEETLYSSLTDSDPLGTPLDHLSGENETETGVELETDGYRIGFPRGTHCDHSRNDGMKCCHMDLFSSLYGMIEGMREAQTFQSIDRRIIATKLRKAAEEAINEPLEMVVGDGPFVVASQHKDANCTCHFRADQYHIMAWRTPGNYSPGVDMFADNGVTSFVGWATCCNKTLRYGITKHLHEKSSLDFSQMDTQAMSKSLTQAAQMVYGSRVETVISRGNFIWRSSTHRRSDNLCKVDLFQFHALIFESGGTPLDGEFESADVQDSDADVVTHVNTETNSASNSNSANQNQNQNQNQQQSQQSQSQANSQAQVQAPPPAVMPPLMPPVIPFDGLGASAAAAAAAGAGACFSQDMEVDTPGGKKKMADLRIGDLVLTVGKHRGYYTAVRSWLHREPEFASAFYEFTTNNKRRLVLTAKHLIFRGNCSGGPTGSFIDPQANGKLIFAERLRASDCVYVNDEQGQIHLERIRSYEIVVNKGIYAPVTRNGKILVNGFAVSCYSEFQEEILMDSYSLFLEDLRRFARRWIPMTDDELTELPVLYSLLHEIILYVVPSLS